MMLPLLPFAAGVITGAVALKLFKSNRTGETLDKARDQLREATVSSLNAIENASARAREKLSVEPASEDINLAGAQDENADDDSLLSDTPNSEK